MPNTKVYFSHSCCKMGFNHSIIIGVYIFQHNGMIKILSFVYVLYYGILLRLFYTHFDFKITDTFLIRN